MKRYIYRLPAHVTDLDDKAYKPQVVSLGPYHHGQPHLKGAMDEHKHCALLHFLKSSGKSLRLYVEALRDAYDQLDPKWQEDDDAFLKMMVVDGCFILEILRMDTDNYAPSDPLFSKHGLLHALQSVKREMLLLEIQVPLLVLLKIPEVPSTEAEADTTNLMEVYTAFFLNGLFRDSKDVHNPVFMWHHQDNLGSEKDVANLFRQSVTLDPESSLEMPNMIAIKN
ncbi:hypothetical protein Sango_1069200 [Sesamum angolense]|uniref:Uncharacterized protein n=1 Tax=Sesamum angolense TaxID=2727404 RepID=A0AAE1WUE5_9LAMI|nr:hypothetical protein Sango_1069200 [Sesamum angolense]